jgi:hypothetical protein
MGDRQSRLSCLLHHLQCLLQPERSAVAMTIEFPITVKSIEWDEDAGPISPDRLFGAKAGARVAVRPVDDEKTYLGVMLGDYRPTSLSFNHETGEIRVTKRCSEIPP